jgi:hypothetical protein
MQALHIIMQSNYWVLWKNELVTQIIVDDICTLITRFL